MRKFLRNKLGLRRRERGQTTAEYAIIVALVAVSSIAIILIFGDQIRELFAGSTRQLAGEEDAIVESQSDRITDDVTEGSLQEF